MIQGISGDDFEELQKELRQRFDSVSWNNGSLTILSVRDHGRLKDLFAKLAACVKPGHYGSLLYVGHGNVACFYFGSGRYLGKRYKEPVPPDWWRPRGD